MSFQFEILRNETPSQPSVTVYCSNVVLIRLGNNQSFHTNILRDIVRAFGITVLGVQTLCSKNASANSLSLTSRAGYRNELCNLKLTKRVDMNR